MEVHLRATKGLCGQELPPGRPGPAGRRIDAGGVEDLPHRGGCDRVAQPGQPASMPPPGFSRAICPIRWWAALLRAKKAQ